MYFGLAAIFEMNLPEGFLRERLRLAFARATGSFDDFDLLSIVGRSQIGRVRYTGGNEEVREHVRFSRSRTFFDRRATHIVKLWDQNEYPQLAANE